MSNLQKRLNELFEYVDGDLYRRITVQGSPAGNKVGWVNSTGYKWVNFDRKKMLMHRVVFVMFHGYEPALIDHIDGDKTNNKIENLREATKSQNGFNRKIHTNNRSGCKNVCWNKQSNCWIVKLRVNKKLIYFGRYKDLDLADLVAHEARSIYHGEFLKGQA